MKCPKCASLVSGIVLALIAVLHIVRAALGWEMMVNGTAIPMWASIVAALICGFLAFSLLRCSCCLKCCCKGKGECKEGGKCCCGKAECPECAPKKAE